ncbi:hydroxymethylglutaryl-CoA lyase, partial [Povalibacter sp.]|uniref:hydroxymethylglutaryl-CoA lyase n=1 Tax=Povalibacter sp. TaxID=1962978 RepID=UPI002F42F648
GLQLEPGIVSTADKVQMIERLISAGLRRVEVTSFVNPKKVPQMADAEPLLAALPRPEGVVFTGLVLNRRGFDRAVAAGCHEIGMVVVASDTFNRRNQGVSTEQSIADWIEMAALARAAGVRAQITISAAFGCPFEGEVPIARVIEIAQRVAEADPYEICFADTIGVGVPAQVTQILGQARALLPDMRLRCHFHNTRNTGIANAMAAVDAGVTTLDASIGGIGGCPFAPAATGNIATEDLLYLLDRSGIQTGVSLPALIDTARWLQDTLGRPIPGMLAKAGEFPRTNLPS